MEDILVPHIDYLIEKMMIRADQLIADAKELIQTLKELRNDRH